MSRYPDHVTAEAERNAFVALCEAEFRTRLDETAEIVASQRQLRFLTLSGPTCSGKTTTARILIDKLESIGHRVTVISLDDFFRDRAQLLIEAKQNGVPVDLDSVKALDLNTLRTFVSDIGNGKPTILPHFDFTEGKRTAGFSLIPHPEDIYLFEGIQAVYPEVTGLFPREAMFSLYISVEDSIATPFGSWLPREIRLLRRLLRDSKFRNTAAAATLSHWGGVTRNELLHIEPYKDGCHHTINSTMPYEIYVLRDPLIALLATVNEGDDHALAARLLREKLLALPAFPEEVVPADSVLREFIGSSDPQ